MKTVHFKKLSISIPALCLLAVGLSACQKADPNANANAPANANIAVATATPTPGTIAAIAAKEPEKYRATLVLSAETEGGQKTIGIPSLSAEVARNGADRRVAFKLPDGSDLIYLDQGGKHMVIAPGRKQYAELTQEATGFQIHKLMTPGQIVSHIEKLKGVEKVGDETINGRTAEKYRYATTTNTSTSAGAVKSEAFVFIDKETGLPLRTEIYSEATGNVQGVKGAKIVAEMRDINTTVDESLFQIPTGLTKVPPEQVRQQIDAFTNTVAALVRALITSMAPSGTSGPPPAAAASPSASSSASPVAH